MPTASSYMPNCSTKELSRIDGLGHMHHSYTSSQSSLQKIPIQQPHQQYHFESNSSSSIQMSHPQSKVKSNYRSIPSNNMMSHSTSNLCVSGSMLSSPESLNNYSNYNHLSSVNLHQRMHDNSNRSNNIITISNNLNGSNNSNNNNNNINSNNNTNNLNGTNNQHTLVNHAYQYNNLNTQQKYHQHTNSHQSSYPSSVTSLSSHQLPSNQQLQQQQQALQSTGYKQHQQHSSSDQVQQTVPMTSIMIPASAASKLQSASQQIQQAAMQAMSNCNNQPQILVLMIPYPVNQSQQNTTRYQDSPEHSGKFGTLTRQANSISVASNASAPNSRTMSSLSIAKQEPEKFYIKANFTYISKNKNEISFKKGDILHVTDTLSNSEDGLRHWFVIKYGPDGNVEKGLIPNQNQAERIVQEQINYDLGKSMNGNSSNGNGSGMLTASVGKVSFLKRKSARRSKSFSKDSWDNVVFEIGSYKLPAFERVVLKHPEFCRPVVIFGPLSDLAREKLLIDYAEKYSYPVGFNNNQVVSHPKVIRVKNIQEIIDQGKHPLLDITPSSVEKLNLVNLCPIVIFMKADKSVVKEFRQRAIKTLNISEEEAHKFERESSRKLMEVASKLEKNWSHVFTATLNLVSMGSEMWYRKLRETIENQQAMNVWMGERKGDKKNMNPMSEVLFPMPNFPTLNNRLPQTSSFVDEQGLSNDESDDSISKSTMNLNLMSSMDGHPSYYRRNVRSEQPYTTKSSLDLYHPNTSSNKTTDIYNSGGECGSGSAAGVNSRYLNINSSYQDASQVTNNATGNNYASDYNYCDTSYFD